MAMKAAEKKLVLEKRKLSRKYRKGPKSQHFWKQKTQVARAHERVSNMRLDFLHKASTSIGETQAVVYVEDLKIRNMTRSARGTRENPGGNVRQKSGLNSSILSQRWGTFLSLLEYKLSQRGGRLFRVDPRNTSRTCFACGHVAAENRTDQTTFRCVSCRYEDHADTNAANNILRAGQGRPAAPVHWINPVSSSPDRSVGESIPVFSPGSWQEGIPFLSAFAASEARGRGGCQEQGMMAGWKDEGQFMRKGFPQWKIWMASQIVKNLIMQNAMRIKCFLEIVSSAAIPKG